MSSEPHRYFHPMIQSDVYRFADPHVAQHFIDATTEPMRMVLGDYNTGYEFGEYLVATPADAEKLIAAGYEYADPHMWLGDESPQLSL